MSKQAAETFGMAMAAADRGVDLEGLSSTVTKIDTLVSSPSYRHGLFKAASIVLEAAGMADTDAYQFLEKSAAVNLESPDTYEDALRGTATCLLQSFSQMDDLEKSAANPIPAIAARFGALTPSVVSTLAALSAAGGAGAGALAWALNRHSREDDVEIEKMKAQIDKYNQIGAEIEDRLRRRGYTTPEEVEDISGAGDVDVDF